MLGGRSAHAQQAGHNMSNDAPHAGPPPSLYLPECFSPTFAENYHVYGADYKIILYRRTVRRIVVKGITTYRLTVRRIGVRGLGRRYRE